MHKQTQILGVVPIHILNCSFKSRVQSELKLVSDLLLSYQVIPNTEESFHILVSHSSFEGMKPSF